MVAGEFGDGHPIDARATFIGLHLSQCCLQVFSLTHFLHKSTRASWAFGVTRRLGRLGRFLPCLPGFTRGLGSEVQFPLDILPTVAPEVHVLLATPLVQAFSVTGYYAFC
jgi:hypothetical protein